MTIDDFNTLVEQAYEAAFNYERELIAVYERAYARQTEQAASRFTSQTVTAAWTPPLYQSLTDGMSETEIEEADKIRDEAALAILAILSAAGVAASSPEFMEAISARAQTNFEQEILRQLRKVVTKSFDAGLSSEATAAAIREQIPQIIPSSAEMLAQTELTALVNERSIVAAQNQFPDGVSKTWLTVGDNRVRAAHASAQGQTVPVDQPFQVGGASLQYPGDPSGPLRLVARCRCRLSFTDDPTAVTAGGTASAKEGTIMEMETQMLDSNMTTWTYDPNTDKWSWDLTAPCDPGVYFLPYPDQLTAGVTITISDDGEAEEVTPDDGEEEMMADGAPWRCLLAVEGVLTEDGRFLDPGSIVWRDLPLTLMAMDETTEGGHLGAKVAGRIDQIWRDGNEIWGAGVFNSDEFGSHIQALVSNQSLRGNSVDLAILGHEYRNPETGEALDDEQIMDILMSGGNVTFSVTEGVILASTVCPTPAIAEANIILASGFPRMTFYAPFREEEVLTASAAGMAPLHPPSAWFDDPKLSAPTPLTVTDDGKVFGHAALWNSCHIAEPNGPGVCVPPPRSGLSYECFHHGAVKTEEGHDVAVGQITMSTFHAGSDLGWKAAREHYEHTGAVVADVRAGEDRHGIWVSGALRPDLPAAKVREMKAGSISGDWRSVIGRGLEFIGALIVNIGGFPVPRPSAHIVASASGEEEVLSLVAAGIVEPADEVDGMSRREYLRKIRALTS